MTENNSQAPLARVFHLKELSGLIGKKMQVPPSRLGVAIYADGKTRTFPPGEHQLLSVLERFRGKGIGLQCGYIPAGALTACLRPECLSGDHELLDVLLICAIEISDPVRFFREVVVTRGEVRDTTLELDPQLIQAALGAVTTQYTASDLTAGRLDARLLPQVNTTLGGLLGNQGLALKEIQLLTVSRAENRAVLAEKAQQLRERLQDIDLQRRMAEIESQSQLDEFVQQEAPELKNAAHISLTGTASTQKGGIAANIGSWLAGISAQARRAHPWLEKLFEQKKQKQEFKVPKPPKRKLPFWAEPTWGIVTTLLVTIIITVIILWLPNWNSKTDTLIGIWAAAVPVVLERVFALIRLREKDAEENWALSGYQYLDNLTGNDRQWADQIVREQCVRELGHIQEIISEIRSAEYKRGNQDFALTLKQTIQVNIQDWLTKVQRPDYARPPYITDLHVSQHAWTTMLDKDEELILRINFISETASQLQQESLLSKLKPEMMADLNAEISKFGNLFFERGRTLQAPPADPNQK